MATVRAFDDAEYQQRLVRLAGIERALAEHELPASDAAATAVLVAVERGVEVLEEVHDTEDRLIGHRAVGVRPAGTSDVAALLDSYGVGAAADEQVRAVAEQVRRADASPAAGTSTAAGGDA